MWDFTLPARISVDYGRDAKADLEEIDGEIMDPAETVEARGRGSYEDFLLRFYRNMALKQKVRRQVEQETGETLSDAPPAPVPAGGGGFGASSGGGGGESGGGEETE